MSRFARACAVEIHMNISQEPFCGNLIEKRRKLSRDTRFCASLHNWNAHGLFTRAILHGNLQEKWPRTPPGASFCASLRSRNAHEHVWKFTGMPHVSPTAIVLCEPAQPKCTWTCHKSHYVWKFTGNWPDTDDTTSIEHRALTVTIRTPQCGHTVWGNIKNSCIQLFIMCII